VPARGGELTHLPTAVKKRRAELGWSQTVLAGQAGVSRQTIARLETGREIISLRNLRQVLDALGIRAVI